MALKLYYDLMSQPSRAIYILLNYCGTKYEKMAVDLRSGAHYTEEYANTVNRFQRVPVIDYNGFILTESVAIVRYLSHRKLISEQMYPSDYEMQARVDEFLEWYEIGLRLSSAMFFRVKALDPVISGNPPDQKKIEDFKKKLTNSLDIFETKWLGRFEYLVTDHLTVADLFAASELEQPRMAGFDPCEGRPRLSKWMNKVRMELSPHYEEAHTILNKIAKRSMEKERMSNL